MTAVWLILWEGNQQKNREELDFFVEKTEVQGRKPLKIHVFSPEKFVQNLQLHRGIASHTS